MFLILAAWGAYAFFVSKVIEHKIVLGDFKTSIVILGVLGLLVLIWSVRRLIRPVNNSRAAPTPAAQPAQEPKQDTESLKEITFHVAGVTYDNDDGTSRQDIIRALRFGDEPYSDILGINDVEIVETSFNGDLAYEVQVNGYQIGFVPKAKISQVEKAMKTHTCTVDNAEFIGGGYDSDGKRLNYGATVTLSYYG